MISFFSKPFTFDRVIRIIICLATIALLFYAVGMLSSVLTPFAVAWLFGYMLQPLVFKVQRFLRYRALSIFVVMLLFFGLLFLFFYVLIPTFIGEFLKLRDMLSNNSDLQQIFVPAGWTKYIESVAGSIDYSEFFKIENIMKYSKMLFPHISTLLSNSMNLLKLLFGCVFFVIYLFFILRDQQALNKGFIQLIPPRHKGFIIGVMQDLKRGMSLYFRKQAVVAMIDAVMFVIGFLIIGMPMAVPMGILLGMLNMVPYMQYLGLPPAAVLMSIKAIEIGDPIGIGLVALAVVFLIVQVVQDFYLIPKIMGDSMGLHPAIVLLSISIWGYLLGVIGIIIALPATTILKSYYKRYILTEDDKHRN